MKRCILDLRRIGRVIRHALGTAGIVAGALAIGVSIPNLALAMTEAKLLDPLGDTQDRFGNSVALSGNYAIVGARYDATQGTDSGKAVIFEFDDVQWIAVVQLLPPNSSDYAVFAESVDISGDYAIVVASPTERIQSHSGDLA